MEVKDKFLPHFLFLLPKLIAGKSSVGGGRIIVGPKASFSPMHGLEPTAQFLATKTQNKFARNPEQLSSCIGKTLFPYSFFGSLFKSYKNIGYVGASVLFFKNFFIAPIYRSGDPGEIEVRGGGKRWNN